MRPVTDLVAGFFAVPSFNAPAALETIGGAGGRSCVTFFGEGFARLAASDITRPLVERVAVAEAVPRRRALAALDTIGDLGGLSLVTALAAALGCFDEFLGEGVLATSISGKRI